MASRTEGRSEAARRDRIGILWFEPTGRMVVGQAHGRQGIGLRLREPD